MISPNTVTNLPEWYELERETEKIIKKLTTVKELEYYLHNQDEYIRRLSLIRLSTLKPKGTESLLREILEDHLESNENKELAAWALKAISLRLNNEVFIDNRYLTRFTGNEKLEDLYKITFEEPQTSIRFNFTQNPIYTQIAPEQDTVNCEQNTGFKAELDFKQWISSLSSNFLFYFKTTVLNSFKFLLDVLKIIVIFIFVKFPKLIFSSVTGFSKRKASKRKKASVSDEKNYYNIHQRAYNNPDIMPLIMHSRISAPPRISIISLAATLVKKVVFNVLYVFFFPIRFFVRHKLAALYIIAALYIFLNFTAFGKITFNKYFGKDFSQVQNKVAVNIKQFSLLVWDEFIDITGLDVVLKSKQAKSNSAIETRASNTDLYSVTAPKGLNIRESPDLSSEKVDGGSLAFGSIVTYLNKTKADSSGRLWYYIQSGDGRSGWVSAKYIKKDG